VCVYSVSVLSCVGSGLATGSSSVQGVVPAVYRIKKQVKEKRFTDALYSKVGETGKREKETISQLV
jgi:hypothetical protein